MKTDVKIVARNLKWLRNLYGENQVQLGAAIGVGGSTISDIERGVKYSTQTIELIAQHYGVPVEMLYSDDSHKSKRFTPYSIAAAGLLVTKALVGFYVGDAPEGSDFRNACEECASLTSSEALRLDQPMLQARLDRCIRVFAAHEEQYPAEAHANTVSAIVLRWLRAADPSATLLADALVQDPDMSDEDFVRLLPNANDLRAIDGRPQQREMIEASYQDVMDHLEALRQIPTWADYAERCVALLYLLGLTDADLDQETSTIVGLEMLKSQALLGNEPSLLLMARLLDLLDGN